MFYEVTRSQKKEEEEEEEEEEEQEVKTSSGFLSKALPNVLKEKDFLFFVVRYRKRNKFLEASNASCRETAHSSQAGPQGETFTYKHHHHQVPDLEQTLATMPLQTSLSSDNFKKFKPLLCPPVAELQRLSRNVIR